MIKKLDDKTIFKIKSDITIPTLSSVLKELFENSLDAGATKIEICLKGNGFKSITVEDNGKGIPDENRENICHRFYTSKMIDLKDGVETFGFRGEALNSLCRDCGSVEVWTKTEKETCGVILNYDVEGDLVKTTPAPRNVGTRVTITDLFGNKPPKREHAMDIYQSQLTKTVEILEEYSLICHNVRIILKTDSKKDPLILKHAFQDINGSISHIFDPKVMKCMECIEYEGEIGKIELYLPTKGTDFKIVSGKKMKQFFYLNGRPVDFPDAKKLIRKFLQFHFFRPDILTICIIEIEKESFEVADSTKRTIYLSQKDELLSKLNKMMESHFGTEKSAGVNIRNFDEQNPMTPSPVSKKVGTTPMNSPPSRTPSTPIITPTSKSTLTESSNGLLKNDRVNPKNNQTTPQAKVSLFQDTPSKRTEEGISLLNRFLEKRKPMIPDDSDDSDDELVELQLSQSQSMIIEDVKDEKDPKTLQKKPWEKMRPPSTSYQSIPTIRDSPSDNSMRFSRHYINRSVDLSPQIESIQNTSSIPDTQINNLLSDPIVENDYLNDSRTIFSQDQITPSFSQDQLFSSKPKDFSPLKRKLSINSSISPQEEKRKKYEEEKKRMESQETEQNDEIFLEVKNDILEGFLKMNEKQKTENEYTNLTKREESKLEDFFSVDKSSLVHTKILGILQLDDEKEVVLIQYENNKIPQKELISFFAFDSVYVEKNLKYYHLMQSCQIPCEPLEDPVNLSKHPKMTSQYKKLLKNPLLKYVFKSNGFNIIENEETKEIELNGIVSREIIPAYGIEDLIDLLDNLSFFETQIDTKLSVEDQIVLVKKNLGYLRNSKVKNYLRKKSKGLMNGSSMTIQENEDQLKQLSECEAISEFSTRTMFKHINSLKKV